MYNSPVEQFTDKINNELNNENSEAELSEEEQSDYSNNPEWPDQKKFNDENEDVTESESEYGDMIGNKVAYPRMACMAHTLLLTDKKGASAIIIMQF